MDNVITISNVKPNTLEFDASIQGLSTDDMSVRFIIEAEGMEFAFPSTKKSGDKWEVTIPAIDVLKRSAYNFRIDLVAEGYHFEPLRGVVNVVGSAAPYVSKPKSVVEPSAEAPKTEEPKVEAKPQPQATPVIPKQASGRSIEQIAKDLMAKAKAESSSDEMVADAVDEKTKKAEEKVVKAEEKKEDKKEEMPSVKTLEPKELAKQHDVPLKDIEAQVKKGTEHEKEHTKDAKTAREIALDHIKEDPKYYDNLEKIEESKKAKKKTAVEKANIRSDTGERPAVNESAAPGSTSSHNVQSGPDKPKPKPAPAPKVDISSILAETASAPVMKPSEERKTAAPKLKKITGKGKKSITETIEDAPIVEEKQIAAPQLTEKESKLKDILAEDKEDSKSVTTTPLKKRAVVYH